MSKSTTKRNILLMRPYMPPREEFEHYLDKIWTSRNLTNGGPIHEEFEQALCKYLGVDYICLLANGTLALMIALKALHLKGEVITTPFTSVATLQAIHWNNLKPVFVDIDPVDLSIHPAQIEAAITNETVAMVPVHVFGNPCDVEGIDDLAKRFRLKVVYDAAHCFGIKKNKVPLCNFGDLSALSFHATKVFNSIEGGAIVCHDRDTKERIDDLKILQVVKGTDNPGIGLNAKLNEIQSAFGCVQLKHIDDVISMRKQATELYTELLSKVDGIEMFSVKKDVEHNYTYMPVLINKKILGIDRDELAVYLEKSGIATRKYFYPLVSDFPDFSIYKTTELPVATDIAQRILCLPLFHDIKEEEIKYIVDAITNASRSKKKKS